MAIDRPIVFDGYDFHANRRTAAANRDSTGNQRVRIAAVGSAPDYSESSVLALDRWARSPSKFDRGEVRDGRREDPSSLPEVADRFLTKASETMDRQRATDGGRVILTAICIIIVGNQRTIPTYRHFLGSPLGGIRSLHARSWNLVRAVRRRVESLSSASSDRLADQYEALAASLADGRSLLREDVVIESFALTTEAVRRGTGLTFYDEQLLGGLALAVGTIAEIQTGEGKTIIAALPAALHALKGDAVHVATTNAYLSERDFRQLEESYRALGLRAALLRPHSPTEEKQITYGANIVYGPGYEFGFDFLRDQLSIRSQSTPPLGREYLKRLRSQAFANQTKVQRNLAFALFDEADSVLIDEATTPLILSGAEDLARVDRRSYELAKDVADRLMPNRHYFVDEALRSIRLSDVGLEEVQNSFEQGVGQVARSWVRTVENALRAKCLLRRDVDYVVRDGSVLIVDQHTGRIHAERSWRSGLHQAVEAKEHVETTVEKQTQARITRQRFAHLYQSISGMTGTAAGSDGEFNAVYRLPVVSIPTHRPCQRQVLPSRYFRSQMDKIDAIVSETVERREHGQPVLVGTRTIHESKRVSAAMAAASIPHEVLNGQQDAAEAEVVAAAGRAGVVTIATNMAGRGTDIVLDELAHASGGLHVIGSEFHESSRVDRQLIGRSARQGDPGSSRFFCAADDEMILHQAPDLARRIQTQANDSGECHHDLSHEVRRLQKRQEDSGMSLRRQMIANDHWLETAQRTLAQRA